MVASHDWSLHLIRKSGAQPEQQLAAALIASAREACCAGDADSCEWLQACALGYLALVIPPEVDDQLIMERLLAGLPTPETSGGWRQNAATFIQLVLDLAMPANGTEAHRGNGHSLSEVRTRTSTLPRGDPAGHLETQALPGLQSR